MRASPDLAASFTTSWLGINQTPSHSDDLTSPTALNLLLLVGACSMGPILPFL
jgi:hypothetical protein